MNVHRLARVEVPRDNAAGVAELDTPQVVMRRRVDAFGPACGHGFGVLVQPLVSPRDLVRPSVVDDAAAVEHQGAVAQLTNARHIVADEHHGASLIVQVLNAAETTVPEMNVADR